MFKVLFCCVFLCLSVSISQQSVLRQVSSDYYVSVVTASFLEALATCQEFGFKLATAPNAEVTKALNETVTYNSWLGGIHLTYNGLFRPKWIWMNSEDDFSNYTNWYTGQPSYYSSY